MQVHDRGPRGVDAVATQLARRRTGGTRVRGPARRPRLWDEPVSLHSPAPSRPPAAPIARILRQVSGECKRREPPRSTPTTRPRRTRTRTSVRSTLAPGAPCTRYACTRDQVRPAPGTRYALHQGPGTPCTRDQVRLAPGAPCTRGYASTSTLRSRRSGDVPDSVNAGIRTNDSYMYCYSRLLRMHALTESGYRTLSTSGRAPSCRATRVGRDQRHESLCPTEAVEAEAETFHTQSMLAFVPLTATCIATVDCCECTH